MGAPVAGTGLHMAQLSPTYAPASSSAHALASVICSFYSNRNIATIVHGGDRALSPFIGLGPSRTPSLELRRGRGGRKRHDGALRRAFSANLASFTDDDDDEDGEFVRRLHELNLQLRREEGQEENVLPASGNFLSRTEDAPSTCCSYSSSSFSYVPTPTSPPPSPLSKRPELLVEPPWMAVQPEPPEWLNQIVPASVEKNANSVGLPLSLRIIKERKKRCERGEEAREPAWRCSVNKAFSSMVFMVRELQSYALHLREAIFFEDLRGILDRVQQEMNSSFVWLFQQIFSGTPTLMVSIMLLLANFTVYSMGHNVAIAANHPPSQSVATTVVHDQQHRRDSRFDQSSIKTLTIGRAASVGGTGGGGGKAKHVAGFTDDGRSDGSSSYNFQTVLPDGMSKVSSTTKPGEEGLAEADPTTTSLVKVQEEVGVWQGILKEVWGMKASTRDQALMDPETLQRLVAPVTAEVEAEDSTEYLQTELMYQQALLQEPYNTLLLANFAQFLYLVLHDHDRAELYFKRAAAVEPVDAEALSQYASFLWQARNDLTTAEETYLEAISADPSNATYAANYAHFLWNTGGEDTCYPLDDATPES